MGNPLKMDRRLIEAQLVEAEKSVEQHRQYIAKQREVVGSLEAKGFDSRAARDQLALFERAWAAFTARRDQLLKQLISNPD